MRAPCWDDPAFHALDLRGGAVGSVADSVPERSLPHQRQPPAGPHARSRATCASSRSTSISRPTWSTDRRSVPVGARARVGPPAPRRRRASAAPRAPTSWRTGPSVGISVARAGRAAVLRWTRVVTVTFGDFEWDAENAAAKRGEARSHLRGGDHGLPGPRLPAHPGSHRTRAFRGHRHVESGENTLRRALRTRAKAADHQRAAGHPSRTRSL
jgi:hypothetical protein